MTIRDLTVSYCYYGIYLLNADAGRVERCRVDDTPSNGMGMILAQGSDGNLITGNRILAASSAGPATNGIVISSSSQNIVTNNEFNNPVNALFGGTVGSNAWSSAKTAGDNIVGGPYLGGNYWAEPDGTGWSQTVADANSDGIGDGAYSLATGNTDFLPLVSRPVADFTATPTSGSAPLTVLFSDRSTGSPTSWFWSFGDGSTSSLRNPGHTYTVAGTYSVSLTVWNAAGQSNTKTFSGLITATPPPPRPTSININYGVRGFPVAIANLAGTNFASGATVKLARSGYSDLYATNVDVVSSTMITCRFAVPSTAATGPWNVVVTNPDGQSGALPGGFTIYQSIALGDAVDAPQLAWNTYGSASWMGSGAVTHDGVDAARSGAVGHSASSSLSTTVAGPATVSFWWKVSSESTYDRLAFAVDGSQTRVISGEVGWRQESVALESGIHNLAWTYAKDGSVTAGSDAGWLDQVTVTAPPIAGFTASPTSGLTPLSVQFMDASTGFPTSWSWSFGDGATSTLRNPTHTYAAVGTYTVMLTVWNAAGLSDSEIKTNFINCIIEPIPTSITPNAGNQGTTVAITNLAGTGFRTGATVKLARSGYSDLYATNVIVVSPTKITCQFAVPSTAATGPWNVVVTNPDGQSGPLSNGFTVTPWSVTLSTGTFQVPNVGGTVSVPIVLSSAPGGLSGYRFIVSLSDPSVSTITAVTFPDWAGLKSSSPLPSGQVVLQGVDLLQQVPVGGTNVILATLTMGGTATGSTGIVITLDPSMGIQDRNGDVYPISASTGILTVLSRPVLPVPPSALVPTDTNGDELFDDVNGNQRGDFADIVLYFNQMDWIAANEPMALFDYNKNGRIDFADVVWLFNNL